MVWTLAIGFWTSTILGYKSYQQCFDHTLVFFFGYTWVCLWSKRATYSTQQGLVTCLLSAEAVTNSSFAAMNIHKYKSAGLVSCRSIAMCTLNAIYWETVSDSVEVGWFMRLPLRGPRSQVHAQFVTELGHCSQYLSCYCRAFCIASWRS